jgi:hypothetical protein
MQGRSNQIGRSTIRPTFARWTRHLGALLIALLLAGAALAQELPEPPAAVPHGMLVLGTQGKVYLVHLAMRTHPAHQFQLIMEAEFLRGPDTVVANRLFLADEAGLDTSSPTEIYFLDRTHEDNDALHYTFVPSERFVLTEIPQGRRSTIPGHLVRGHFEGPAEDRTLLLGHVEVKINRILYFQDLREPLAGIPHPLSTGKLEFLLFGGDGEYFVEHRITLHGQKNGSDDNGFHQIFAVKAGTAELLNFDLTRRTALLEIDGAHATPVGRLPEEGGTFSAQLLELVQGVDTPLPLDLELEAEHYLEVLF